MKHMANLMNTTSTEIPSLTTGTKGEVDYMSYLRHELVKRNWGFIHEDLQEKISQTSLLFAGCGLGSTIATTAARTGFVNYMLIDGDIAELSNLNRQAFSTDDLGQNKAYALSVILQKINPLIESNIISTFIEVSDIHDKLLNDCDYIINTVDMNETYFELIDEACSRNKTVLVPLNIGFGGCLMVFNSNSLKIGDIVNTSKIETDLEFFGELWTNLDVSKLPEYIQLNISSILESIDKKGYNPQLGIAANITASLVITTIIRLIDGQPIPVAPDFITIDAYEPP